MKFCKKIFVIIMLFAMICIASIPAKNYVYAATQSRGVVLFSCQQKDDVITVTTTLKTKEDGISSFDFTLDYDSSVMTLFSAESGNALNNVITSGNFSVTPYKLNWESDKNVSANGTLYTFKFKIKENAPNGSYKITYTYDNDNGINYYEKGNPVLQKAKFSIETAVVNIDNGNITVTIENVNEDTTNWTLVVILSVVAAAIISGGTYLLIKFKKQKGWKKIAK